MVHPLLEIDVTQELVRSLLREQHPDLADLPLSWAGTGWDNALWRVGEHLTARFPVREVSAPLVTHEQRWLPVLAPLLPVDVPVPVRVGVPSAAYPWAWSVVPWFDGVPAHHTPVPDRTAWAPQLAEFFLALHRPAPADAPANPFRGVPLDPRAEVLVERVERLGLPDADRILERRRDLAAAPPWDGPPLWLHGDPHPANLLAHDGRLRAVIDFGDVTSGDPASDLATAWLTFDAEGRARLRERLAYDSSTWRRAQAWALHMAVVLQMHPVDHPHLAEIGRHGISQALSD
ncbi:aminoglycoside phosphotransferase family protein [Cellulomonas fengjieae]|uniref:Aminoglycoside phosphotransferase family protein n=1 Tax=Cellulomonas fengjieae TaxID=2819978 RepID=A0ABS3SEN5_9CELL|nr:aminoglycoside phosphotransferase family protein [Cellulomonas fengjieae]MBO3084218.1 aminoglycoside phosphotransferase family protein [Cellulomonas fengjieae]QVI64540.1 aminoglycoside phosphotransferase family protein [Cellulomonas fengjieae]